MCSRGFKIEIRVLFFSLATLFLGAAQLAAVPIKGVNGSVVDFAGIKMAKPSGLEVLIQKDGELVVVPWDRIDLIALKAEQPGVFAAYETSRKGVDVELNLGVFMVVDAKPTPPVTTSNIPGRYSTTAKNGKFFLQMPVGGDPKGVLLLSMGQDGSSSRFMGVGHGSRWSKVTEKLNLAILAYEFPVHFAQSGDLDVLKAAPFIASTQGSGEAVFEALEKFAALTKRERLATAPIAVYGADVLGAAFAYNFTLNYPERIIAAVVSKGAFYITKPTEVSTKVPMMILWGEYDEDINRWNPTDKHKEVYEAALAFKPNWVYAMEPRGLPGESPQAFFFGLSFLDRMILARLDPEGQLKVLDRSRSFTGDLGDFSFSRMDDPDVVLDGGKTWLPDGEVAKMWEEFSNGTFKIPSDGQ
jgi:hypothetical protein